MPRLHNRTPVEPSPRWHAQEPFDAIIVRQERQVGMYDCVADYPVLAFKSTFDYTFENTFENS
jgi:hypothetical protein